jgi:hypothetical protein
MDFAMTMKLFQSWNQTQEDFMKKDTVNELGIAVYYWNQEKNCVSCKYYDYLASAGHSRYEYLLLF